MIEITRALARQLRAVFRRCVARGSPFLPIVTFKGSADGLRVRLHRAEAPAEFVLAGLFPKEILAIPFQALADFEGKDGSTVVIETTDAQQIQARWADAGVPQGKNYDCPDINELPEFPSNPESFTLADGRFLSALADAVKVVARESIRYATDKIQVRGQIGQIVSTDSRQLLLQGGFQFPFPDTFLIPALSVFGCRELNSLPMSLGKTDKFFTLQAGPWTLHLPIDSEGRFPRVEEVIPSTKNAVTRCRITPEDAAFLARTLPRLPGDEDIDTPITLDLNGQACVRACAPEQKQATEVVLARSEVSGEPVCLRTDRHFLMRALELGLTDINVIDDAKPIVCKDSHRKYVWMSLGKAGAIAPSDNCFRILSTDVSSATKNPKPRKGKPTVSTTSESVSNTDTPAANGTSDSQPRTTGATRRKVKKIGLIALVEEAQALKADLRKAYVRSAQLIAALKRHKQQTRAVQSTLRSLRELQSVDA